MKKYLIIIIFLLLLTGCDVTYNITVDNNIEELTNFYFEESDYNYDTYYDDYGGDNLPSYSNINEFVDSIFNKNYLAFDGNFNNQELYNVQRINNGISLNYSYKYENFDKSSILNYCGDIVEYQAVNDIVNISVIDFSNCFLQVYGSHLNNLTINVKSDLKVLENNADEVNGNVYTWKMSKVNFYDKKLNIKIKKDIVSNKKSTINYTFIFVVLVILIVLVTILIFYIFKRRKESNEI